MTRLLSALLILAALSWQSAGAQTIQVGSSPVAISFGACTDVTSNPISGTGNVTTVQPIDGQEGTTSYPIPGISTISSPGDACAWVMVGANTPVSLTLPAATTPGYGIVNSGTGGAQLGGFFFRVWNYGPAPAVLTVSSGSTIANGRQSITFAPNTGCGIAANSSNNYDVSDCSALQSLPNAVLFGDNDSIPSSQASVYSGFDDLMPANEALSNSSFWTASGLAAGGGQTAPDGTSNGTVLTTGTAATETLVGSGDTSSIASYLSGLYVYSPVGVQWVYLTLANGSNVVTSWFDVVNCLAGQGTASGTFSAFRAAYVQKQLGGFDLSVCRIFLDASISHTGSITPELTIGVSSANGSTTWSGAAGNSVNVWGADLFPASSTAFLAVNASLPPHLPVAASSGASTNTTAGLMAVGGANINRVIPIQAIPLTASCNGTGSATVTAGSTDMAGSLTTGTGSTSCTITFANSPVAWPTAPFCEVASQSSSSIATSTETTSAISVTLSAALSAGVVKWHCI